MGYFESNGFKQDFNHILKAIVLISKKLEDLTKEIVLLREALVPDSKENKTID